MINTIHNTDCLQGLKTLPDGYVNCCVTSPPYFGLRDYGVDGQIGLEETPDSYVQKLVDVFSEVKRVLKKDGTLWLNIGDSYSGSNGNGYKQTLQQTNGAYSSDENFQLSKKMNRNAGCKPKDLLMIPAEVAIALRKNGWYLRQDIIWHKPNPMPESVTDRCTKSHEYIFLLSKSRSYYYDDKAIQEDSVDPESFTGRRERNAPTMAKHDLKNLKNAGSIKENGKLTSGQFYEKRNKRSVWTVTTKPYAESHFATFPEDLIVDCIKAGCPENGIVLDPFMGAGTTALVASKLNRNYIGFELNPEYISIANKRLSNTLGLFNPAA